MSDVLVWLGLVLLGVAVGAYGTLIGAGGGFVLAPVLLILYPGKAPELITSISLFAVLANSLSGSIAYGRQKRIDYRVALIFAATEVPGAIAGALTTQLIPRSLFEGLFGLILLAVAVLLLFRPVTPVIAGRRRGLAMQRIHTDAHGDTYLYYFNPIHGCLVGLAIGYFSSAFGVGGGFIYVPAMVLAMRFPIYIATATSTFALMFASATATTVHVTAGHFEEVIAEALTLAIGVVIGAQVGAIVSARIGSRQAIILRLLSPGLLVVGLRLLVGSLL